MSSKTNKPGLRGVIKPLAFAAALAAATLTVLHCSHSEPSDPTWTEADLPSIASDHNGWITAHEAAATQSPLDAHPSLTPLLESLRTPSDELDRAATWATVRDVESDLAASIEEPSGAELLEAWHRAATAKDYVDACPLMFDARCNHMGLLSLHQLALLEALHHGAQSNWEVGFRLSTHALRMSGRYLATAHETLSAVVALTMVGEALAVADLMLWQHELESGGAQDQRQALVRAIQALELDRRTLRHVVIGEYIRARTAMDAVVEEEGPSLLLDHGATTTELARIFDDKMQFIDGDEPELTRSSGDCDSWRGQLFNSAGCIALRAFADVAEISSQRLANTRDELAATERRRRALLARLEPSATPAAP